VRGRFGRVEVRAAGPDVIDIVDPKMRVLEKMRGLIIDFERVVFI
jgi:hypothetical protein